MGKSAVDFDDVMTERGYEGLEAYCRSKLAYDPRARERLAALTRDLLA